MGRAYILQHIPTQYNVRKSKDAIGSDVRA